jgi:hypothetical protein
VTTALNPLAYRRVVGRFATGITVITTVLPTDTGEQHLRHDVQLLHVRLAGPRAGAVLRREGARFHDVVLRLGLLGGVRAEHRQERLSRHFAVRGRELEGQFDELPHTLGPITGAVVLDGALAAMECRTVSVTDAAITPC